MEDVLEVYTRPYDPRRPQVCLDETSRQLLAEVSPPRPPAPGRPARQDYEYQRGGVCNLFLVTEPLAGWPAAGQGQRPAHPHRLGALPSRTWSTSVTRMPNESC
jgi:hypothetical protein